MNDDAVDRAAELLRRERSDVEPNDDALVELALLAGRARHRHRSRRQRVLTTTLSGALAACLVGGVLWFGGQPGDDATGVAAPPELARAPEPEASGLEIGPVGALGAPTSSRAGPLSLVTTEHTRFEFEPTTGGHRALQLQSGAMLFELAHLDDDESFVVHTPHLSVRVVGTIFSVERRGEWSAVEVFEGEVEVRDESGVHSLRPGDSYGRPGEGLRSLRSAGREAAERRADRERAGNTDETSAEARRSATREARSEARLVASGETQTERRAEASARAHPSLRPNRPSAAAPEPRVELRPDSVRGWIVLGRADEALTEARRHPSEARWRFVEADALRALSRPAEAAARYDAAIRGLPTLERREAAYLAARLHLAGSSPERAIASLVAGGVTDPGSSLRERGLALRGDALNRLGRMVELRGVAEEYRRDFPTGGRAAAMGRILDGVR